MKKTLTIIGLVCLAIVIIYSSTVGTYNKIISLEEDVKSAWSQVENQYQRRNDLIPNLVNTVKGYAGHEEDVLTKITQARSMVGSITNTGSDITGDTKKMNDFATAQTQLTSSLQRLLVVAENYPELKANTNFLSLQDELAGTENRISVERKRYNETVKTFNSTIRKFPASIVANFNNFEPKAYFESNAPAQAPEVKF